MSAPSSHVEGAAALDPAPDPLIGRTLAERYRVLRRLGEGGMGAVYEAEHLLIKKRVAIKVLHATLSTSAEIVARFHQEALAATAIGHEHIVEVNDMGRTPDGALFMVLEYLQGRDFEDLLEKESPLPIGRVVHVVMQMCDALQAAHDKGIVHRDLKPENVFLVKRGGDPDFVKVLDFGISKMRPSEGGGPRAATRTGTIMGTALYMSPEQAMGRRDVDHRTDVWALGVILYRAITTRFPFLHEAFPALILQICSEQPTPPSRLRSDVDPVLEAIIMRCLEKAPDARPRSCAELLSALAPYRQLTAVLPSTRFSLPAPSVGPAPMRSSGVPKRETGPDALADTHAATEARASRPVEQQATAATASELRVLRQPARTPLVLGFVAVALVAIGGVGWGLTRPGDAPATDAPPHASAPDPADPVGGAPREPEPPRAAEAAASIEFVVSPAEAVVLVDGRPIRPGADGAVRTPIAADDLAVHELRVEARGFRARVEDLRLSYAQRVVVALDPGTGVEDRRAAAATGTATSPAGPRARGARGERAAGSGAAPAEADAPARASASAESASPITSAAPPSTSVASRETETPGSEVAPRSDPPPEGVVVPPPRRVLKRVAVP